MIIRSLPRCVNIAFLSYANAPPRAVAYIFMREQRWRQICPSPRKKKKKVKISIFIRRSRAVSLRRARLPRAITRFSTRCDTRDFLNIETALIFRTEKKEEKCARVHERYGDDWRSQWTDADGRWPAAASGSGSFFHYLSAASDELTPKCIAAASRYTFVSGWLDLYFFFFPRKITAPGIHESCFEVGRADEQFSIRALKVELPSPRDLATFTLVLI